MTSGQALSWELRLAVAALCVLAAAADRYVGGAFWPGTARWFLLALVIGLVLNRWRALWLAPLPWPLGVGSGLATGRYAYLGEAWLALALIDAGAGLLGIAAGIALHRAIRR